MISFSPQIGAPLLRFPLRKALDFRRHCEASTGWTGASIRAGLGQCPAVLIMGRGARTGAVAAVEANAAYRSFMAAMTTPDAATIKPAIVPVMVHIAR